MEFPYIKVLDFPRHQKRNRFLPWIRFGLYLPAKKSKVVFPLGLIDSGSDITIVDHEFAQTLGIEVKKGRQAEVIGVGGGRMSIYGHRLGIEIHNGSDEKPLTYTDLVWFTFGSFPSCMPQQTAILGTSGFFDKLRVTFTYPFSINIIPLPKHNPAVIC